MAARDAAAARGMSRGTMMGMRSNFLAVFLLSTAPLIWAQQSFVPSVIATPGNPSSILYGFYGGELVRSQDLGNTWTPLYITPPGLPQPPMVGFAIDPTNSSTLYYATSLAAGAIWKSTDGGNTWTQDSTGLPTSGGSVEYFKVFNDPTGTYLYILIGNRLYRSTNGGAMWLPQSVLPTPSGTFIVSESSRVQMYWIDAATLKLYSTFSEGTQWVPILQVPGGPGSTTASMGVPYYDPNDVYVTVNDPVAGPDAYASFDGGAFADQSGTGLGPFVNLVSAATGATYALTTPPSAFFRSTNSGQSWQSLGVDGLQHFGATAVDPNVRTTLYGVEIQLPSPTPIALIQSLDGGNSWSHIAASITPTIAKPVPSINVTLEQGAPYSAPLPVQLAENPAWQTQVSVTTSGESWLQLAQPSGITPLNNETITISTAGLLPGVYNSTITISAPQTFNKSVSIPVQLTVQPLGALGPGYIVSTVAGNGSPAGGATTGVPTKIAVGDVRAVAIDLSGNVDFSAGNRFWQFANGNLTVLAGNGVNASNGDGNDPLNASIADPDAIAFDSSGNAYLPEYALEEVRKYGGGNISTPLFMSRFNQPVGAHTLVIDPALFMLLPVPTGILRFDGSKLTSNIPTTLSNPYSMLEDSAGNLYVSDMGLNQILEITPAGVVTVMAGTGSPGFGGDGGPASQAMLNAPAGIAFDAQGTLYIADSGNNRIRIVTKDGNIRTIAGSGLPGFAGDGSTADFASFQNPLGVAVDGSGNVYVADAGNFRLRVLAPQNTPTPQPRAVHPMQGPNVATTLSPGSIFSLYGSNLAPAGYKNEVTTTTWPRDMNGVSVTINGIAAPLYYVSPTQINGQIPFETAPGTATAMIAVNGSLTAQISFPVAATQPDVLVQGGGTQAIAVNQTGAVNTTSTPAHQGDIEVVYLTGIGIPSPTVATGDPSPSSPPLAMANYPYTITLNGQQVPVAYLGYAPGFPALVQANFKISQGITGNVSLVITVNGQSSAPTFITVQ
jgi:uncharacterized protein (TIGR03437 family)